jgi:hypothetical protein
MRKSLDRSATISPKRGRGAGPSAEVEGAYCFRLTALALIAITLITTNLSFANAYPLKRYQQDWALVAMNHLKTLDETQCWVSLIWRESRFNPNARNGSHYGLAQMRSTWYKELTPRQQVKAHMNYLDHRYDGSACKALNHLLTKGWH